MYSIFIIVKLLTVINSSDRIVLSDLKYNIRYNNMDNPEAHFLTMGPEVCWQQKLGAKTTQLLHKHKGGAQSILNNVQIYYCDYGN